MEIDGITVILYDNESGDDAMIRLGYSSGDDIYPDIELSDEIHEKIANIRKAVWG